MAYETDMPFPIRFNPFKHHRNYIWGILQTATPDEIITLLDLICNNYIDIYTGTIAPEAIGEAVIDILKSKQVILPEDFDRWVATGNGFQQIRLQDESEWVLRKGNETERYIHLHPSRTGPLCFRFKGSTLKTAFILKTVITDVLETISLTKVNYARSQVGLSPVKKLEKGKGIINCYEKFFR
jgi:hypothetical protein